MVTAGHGPALARAEREVGLASTSVAFASSPSALDADETVFGDRRRLDRELRRWRLLLRAATAFDVVHFNFGLSLMPVALQDTAPRGLAGRIWKAYASVLEGRDVGWLRRLGKAIFVTYLGDDARQFSVLSKRLPPDRLQEFAEHYASSGEKRRRASVARFARLADGIFALNPDLLEVLPSRAEFLPYASVDPRRWEPSPPTGHDGELVIGHAPSLRLAKGTDLVVSAIEGLRAAGEPVELRIIEGVPHAEARRQLASCDAVVDQLLYGWYGTVAVEAMAMAKPVVARLDPRDLERIPAPMRAQLPIVNVEPEELGDRLRALTARREELTDLGLRGRAFVERWHDPIRIAERMKNDYEQAVARISRR
jgi:glycosyltransferase involved in cell wall biosynthesis